MNAISLIGRLTKDVEIKAVGSTQVANFTLAVDRSFKNKDGNKETDFINCQAWGKTGEIMAQYLSKGDQAGVEGRLQVRSWESDGGKRYATEVVVEQVTFIGSDNKKDKQADFVELDDSDDFPF